jgi:hypothetical protein
MSDLKAIQVKLVGIRGAGCYALVSPADYPRVARHSWYYKEGYAVAKINRREVRMHRFILGTMDPDVVVDHKDRNRLNNTRENLREFTLLQNANNRCDNVQFTCFGETKTIAEWSRDSRCLVSYQVLRSRILNGVPAWAAILAPTVDYSSSTVDYSV